MAEISITVKADTPVAVTAKKNKHQKLANLTDQQQTMIFELVENTKALDKLIAKRDFLMKFI